METTTQLETRRIVYNGVARGVVMQNENGPCPIIAVANVLSLRGNIDVPVSLDVGGLLNILANFIMTRTALVTANGGANDKTMEYSVNDTLTTLPQLKDGLDLNAGFSNVDDYESSPALALFDVLNIPLLHGWVVDPQETDVVAAMNGRRYNQLIEEVACNKSPVLREWLEHTGTQLTHHGLFQLHARLSDDELCVFFRNNHYSVLTKHRRQLYTLVTDVGLAGSGTWESLSDVDGAASQFVNTYFNERSDQIPLRPNRTPPSAPLATHPELAIPAQTIGPPDGRAQRVPMQHGDRNRVPFVPPVEVVPRNHAVAVPVVPTATPVHNTHPRHPQEYRQTYVVPKDRKKKDSGCVVS